MSWKPRMDFPYSTGLDGTHVLPKEGGKNLIERALALLLERFPFTQQEKVTPIRDGVGMKAVWVGELLLVAKRKPYGNIVSFSEEAIRQCRPSDLVLLYLESVDTFYAFKPATIWTKGKRNMFNGQSMLNILIKEGVRWGKGSI